MAIIAKNNFNKELCYLSFMCLYVLYLIIWTEISELQLLFLHFIFLLLGLLVSRANISHPITMFCLVFTVYTIAYPILVSNAILVSFANIKETIYLHTTLMIGYMFPLMALSPINVRQSNPLRTSMKNYLYILLSLFVLLGFVDMFLTVFTGSQKGEESQLAITKTGFAFHWSIILCGALIIDKISSGRSIKLFVVVLFSYYISTLFFSGERSYFVKFVIVVLIIKESYIQKLNFKRVIIMLCVAFLFFGISKQFSNIVKGLNGFDISLSQHYTGPSVVKGVVLYLFYKEFKTSGRITDAVIDEYKGKQDFGTSFVKQLSRSLTPGPLRGAKIDTASSIIEEKLVGGKSNTGLGFSIVASGYIILGSLGVFLFGCLSGILAKILYMRSRNSMVGLLLFSLYIATLCITIRHGYAGTYSTYVKSILLPFIIFVCSWIFICRVIKGPGFGR